MFKPVLFAAPLALGLLSCPAFAEDEAARAIVVTATKTPAAAATMALSTLSEEDLTRRQASFLADQLATLPGVLVSQNGPFGGQATVRIRGAASEQTLVLIDGVSVNDPTTPGGGFNVGYLDAADVARIEVLRGPQSTLWGSDAIGGVVNVVTKRPQAGLAGRAFAEAGSFDTRRVGASASFGGERIDGRLGGVLIRSDGVSKADTRDGARERDGYENDVLDGRLGLDVAPSLRLEAFGRTAEATADFDGFGTRTGVQDSADVAFSEERSGGLAARHAALDGRLSTLVLVSRAEIERRNRNAGRQTFATEGFRDGARLQSDFKASDALRFAVGAEREEAKVKGAGSIRIDGLFALAEASPAPALTVTAGVRRDDHSRFGDVTTTRFGARYALSPAVAARASWGEGFKAPTIFQLTSFFPPATGPNLALEPEEAKGWDAALVFGGPGARITGELGVFKLDTRNQISFAGGRYVNIAKVESRGVEGSARWTLSPSLILDANYTYTDAEDGVTGRRLIRIPRHAAFLEADWRATAKLGLSGSLRYNGEEPDLNTGPFPSRPVVNAAWTRLDLQARYALSETIEAYARIENATDEDYQDLFGYGTPGRSGAVGLRVRLE